jgi:hypothetical protein
MTFFGKGAFLGRFYKLISLECSMLISFLRDFSCEIPFKHLLKPPMEPVLIPLSKKAKLEERKQKYVGGEIILKYGFEGDDGAQSGLQHLLGTDTNQGDAF